MTARIKKGDNVIVITGKDKGRTGEVLKVLPKDSKAVVAGVNINKVHKKPTMQSAGQIIEIEKPIHISNISLVEDGKPVRVKFQKEDGKTVRISKKTGNKVGK